MKLSASKAAKEVGVSVPTITRAIKSGRLSATPLDSGGYEIDPAELFRVWPSVKHNGNATPEKLGDTTPHDMAILRVELEAERRLLADRTSQLEDMRTERDKWQQQAQTLLLNAPANQSVKAENTPSSGLRGIISRVWQGKAFDAA